jgi:hypothetical protein
VRRKWIALAILGTSFPQNVYVVPPVPAPYSRGQMRVSVAARTAVLLALAAACCLAIWYVKW